MKEAELYGKITSSVTHELQNVLAVIGENAGLMEDLINFSKTAFPKKERSLEVLRTITEQIERGGDLIAGLNRMGHLWEKDSAELILGASIDEVLFLSRRFAYLKKITLEVGVTNPSVKVYSKPLEGTMAIFAALEYSLNAVKIGGSLKIAVKADERAGWIGFSWKREDSTGGGSFCDSGQEWEDLRLCAEKGGGSLVFNNDEPGFRLCFRRL